MTEPLPAEVDAIVVGGGVNGLVSAALLADSGWSVLLLEAEAELGGAIKSVHSDGWTMDWFSSSYPLAVASPVLRGLGLQAHGLRWARSDIAVAHPLGTDDRTGALIHRDPAVTAANLAEQFDADGAVWLDLCAQYADTSGAFLDAMLVSWPPINAARKLAKCLGGKAELLRFARFLSLSTQRMGTELFAGDRGRALLAGNAMHADAPANAPMSGLMGWLLAMLAQDVGFPVPVGGAGMLAAALAGRARSAGAELRTREPVTGIDVVAGTARSVRTGSGHTVRASKAIIADVSAPALYERLLDTADLPVSLLADLGKLEWDYPTVKVNYRLAAPARWTAEHANSAGVVHAGADCNGLVRWSADLDTGRIPKHPFALIGQTSTVDSTRSPAGTQAMWAYSHLPRGVHDDASAQQLADRMQHMIAAYAPGFESLILDRDVQTPSSLSAQDANLVHGAVNGGSAQLHQQLIFRPIPGGGGARTVVGNLYLGSAAIHPGGGVHGACGAFAAKAALSDHGRLGAARRRVSSTFLDRLYRGQPRTS